MSTETPHAATASRAKSALRAAARVNVALHVIGLLLAATALRPGTPAAPLAARLAYLTSRPAGWTLGWLTWIACAVALAAFMILLARAVPSPRTGWGAALALAGAIVDIAGDLAYGWVLPAHAAIDAAAFVSFEHRLSLLSLTVANGLYSVAVLVSTLALPTAATAARGLGVLTFVGGMVLAGAGLTGDPRHVMVGTAVTITSFMAWTLVVSSSRQR
jgi:hypothetical protein